MKDKTFSRRMVIGCGLGMVVTIMLAAVYAQETWVVDGEVKVERSSPCGDGSAFSFDGNSEAREKFTIEVTPDVGAAAPQFDPIQRTRYVMSLIRGEFNPDTGALVQISLADANDWAEAFYTAYGPVLDADGEAIAWADLTADQKGRYYLRQLRKYHIAVRRSADIPAATDAAKATAEAAVATAAEIFPEIEE